MKRFALTLVVLAMALLLAPLLATAAGTVSYGNGWEKVTQRVWCLTITWTADASDGSVPLTEIPDQNISGHVMLGVTDPGSPAPTDNYDIEFVDDDGVDVFGLALHDRDTADSEAQEPAISYRYFTGALDFTLTGNSVNSAAGTCKVFLLVK